MKTLVIIPAYNESGSIVRVCKDLMTHCPQMDMLVVNDGSRDETVRICRENDFALLDLPVNLGLSGAMGAGMKYAYLHGYDAAIQFDGDGQHRAEYLPELVKLLEQGADIACGSRFVTQKKPASARMLGSRMISLAIRLADHVTLSDPTSGLRAYNKSMIREYATEMNHPPEPDTLSYLIKRGAIIRETQVTMDERQTGQSYLNAMTAIKYMLKMFISILLVQPFRKGDPIHPTLGKGECAL